MKKTLLVLAIPAIAMLTTSFLFTPQKADAQSGSRAAKSAHHEVLWRWLKRAKYTKWNGAEGKPPELVEGESPHGAFIKTYVSAKASTNLKDLPSGSVIIKENYSPEKKLMAITVMQRSKGYDPEHGDWFYAKYMPNGKIARTPPEMKSMPIAGKFSKCIECHSNADGEDFAFFND